ncbi:MAG TPA: ABC transporter ATP-binding protein [Blastocatellia bacterium]|nr:ABC transporter ATP-binding protein [Blastocatellia bacterium]
MLKASKITRRFGKSTVLDQVSFSVPEGEVLGLIGPNGAGKTTLFECLAGLLTADAGEVVFRDGAARRDTLFYLPDGIRPWAGQTTGFALRFFAGLFGRNQSECDELIAALKLERLLNSRIGSLSKGECKRTLLALSLLAPQPLLLLDEPFDGLDLRQTRDVMTLLRAQKTKGRTLFLSIHQLTDAARVCDRLVLLSAGRVVGAGTLTELKAAAGLREGGLEEVFLALT